MSLLPSISQHASFFKKSVARGLPGRRNEVVVAANAPIFSCKRLAKEIPCVTRPASLARFTWPSETSGSRSPPAGNPSSAVCRGSATVGGGFQPAQRLSRSGVDCVRCVLPTTYITNTYPHTPRCKVVSVRFCLNFEVYKCLKNFIFLLTKE